VDEPTSLHDVRPDYSPALADLIHELLAKDPDRRPASARALIDRLRNETPTPRSISRRRVRPLVACLVGAAALVILAAGVFTFKNSKGEEFTITTDDPTIEVLVKGGGKEVVIVDPTTKQRWKLDTEKYRLSDADRPEGL